MNKQKTLKQLTKTLNNGYKMIDKAGIWEN